MFLTREEVQLVPLDWDDECEKDFLTGRGFEITEPAFKGKEVKSKYGIQSPLFGTDWEDDDAFSERYSCKCKTLVGRVYESEVCVVCNTKVQFRDIDLRTFGWIKLNDYSIIQPIYYNMLGSLMGKAQLLETIEYDKDINQDGWVSDKVSKTNPFKGIGLVAFKERFDEILEFYWNKKKKKRDIITELENNKKKVFASCIPVYSSVLRPVSFKNESFFNSKIYKKYNVIVSDSRLLYNQNRHMKKRVSKKARLTDLTILSEIQKELMVLWELVFSEIDRKKGHIRSQVLGGRVNFSARNVIIPDPTLESDQVRVGYLTFLELYRNEIIAYMVKMNNCTYNQAFDDWSKATLTFDPKVYEIMMYIVKKTKPPIIINRNPTINYGSLLQMEIIDINREYEDDYTMSLPIQILKVLNADFDGDILNIVALKTKKLAKAYRKNYNPRLNMYISRNDGLFNNDFNLMKDQLIGLYEFNNI